MTAEPSTGDAAAPAIIQVRDLGVGYAPQATACVR